MPHGMSNVQVRRLRSAPKPDTVLACHRSYNSTSNGQLTQHIMVDVFTKTPLVLTNPMLESPAELVLRLGHAMSSIHAIAHSIQYANKNRLNLKK